MYPHWVACNFLGGINLPVISAVVETLLKWDIQLKYVNRFNTCDTPALSFVPPFIPQLPVANELFNIFSIYDDLIILWILISFIIESMFSFIVYTPDVISFDIYNLISFTILFIHKYVKLPINTPGVSILLW